MINTLIPPKSRVDQGQLRQPPVKTLQQKIISYRSGQLTISDPNDSSVGWRIYFDSGKIHYVDSTMGQGERLAYLLQRYGPKFDPVPPRQLTLDYPGLCQLWRDHHLPLKQLRTFVAIATQEALTQILAIPQIEVQFEPNPSLFASQVAASLQQLISPLRDSISHWALMRSDISSPFQKLSIRDHNQFQTWFWAQKHLLGLQRFSHALDQMPCLYRLATLLNQDVIDLATQLQPLIKIGVIGVQPYCDWLYQTRPEIAYLDQQTTTQRLATQALRSAGYSVLQLEDPTQALPPLLERQPVLVMMSMEMLQPKGYQLCQIIRQTPSLQRVPILLLSETENMFDSVRARMVGATPYLIKPFRPHEFLTLIQDVIPQQN